MGNSREKVRKFLTRRRRSDIVTQVNLNKSIMSTEQSEAYDGNLFSLELRLPILPQIAEALALAQKLKKNIFLMIGDVYPIVRPDSSVAECSAEIFRELAQSYIKQV